MSLPVAKKLPPGLFLRQGLQSNFCGVYTVGMLLTILGARTTRAEVRRLFGVRRAGSAYRGTDPGEMAGVLRRVLPMCRATWRHQRCSFRRLLETLHRATRGGAYPTIMILEAVRGRMRVRHAVVAFGAVGVDGIATLDPLGGAPERAGDTNALLLQERTRRGYHRMGHGVYGVDLSRTTSVLFLR